MTSHAALTKSSPRCAKKKKKFKMLKLVVTKAELLKNSKLLRTRNGCRMHLWDRTVREDGTLMTRSVSKA